MSERISPLLQPIQNRAKSEAGCSSDPCGSKVCKAQRDRARLLAAVTAVDSILSQAITMISADPDVSEYERGFDDSTCGLSAKLRSAVEAALRSEA